MDDVVKGFTAGFIATLVVTAMMTIKARMGLAPGLDVISLLAELVAAPGQPLYGWLAHFAVGMVVWGGLFALASDLVPGPYVAKGISFGVAGWLLMMFLFFPLAVELLFFAVAKKSRYHHNHSQGNPEKNGIHKQTRNIESAVEMCSEIAFEFRTCRAGCLV